MPLVRLVLKVLLDLPDKPALPVTPEQRVILVLSDLLVLPVPLVLRDSLVPMELMAPMRQ